MNSKIKWLRDKISRMDMQGIIISNPINISYLLGIKIDDAILLLTRKENIIITDRKRDRKSKKSYYYR